MDLQEKAIQLREEIVNELKNTTLNYGRILELSSKLSEMDPDFVRFSVDAGHISRLGKELVGRQETAVSELVKNAYDADATSVKVTFIDTDEKGGSLRIWDNGHGMTREQIVGGFMRLSTSDKLHNPVSPIYKRTRAGRKGIGRFAAQRLGNKLTLTTRTADDDHPLRLRINWLEFAHDQEIFSIANKLEVSEKDRNPGTTLHIGDLCDAWTDSQIKRVYRYIGELLQPFPLSKADKKNESDPGFQVTFFRQTGGEERQVIADDETEIFRHAVATIEGFVNDEGFGYVSFNSKKLNIKENDIPISRSRNIIEKYQELRSIHFKAHYFIHLPEYIPGHQLSRIKDLANTRGGIRVYRNGFRVLPYGEPYNDWLKLDASTRGRALLIPHANNNFFGYVEIKDKEGVQFEETASREGLIENEAFEELTEFVASALKSAVLRINSVRDKKLTAGQRDWKSSKDTTPSDKVRSAAGKILKELGAVLKTTSGSDSEEGQDHARSIERLAVDLNSAADEQESLVASYLQEIGMLRVLASLGLTIGQFTHEIRHNLSALRADIDYFESHSETNTEEYETSIRLKANFKALQNYAAYFDASIAANVKREVHPIELSDVINRFKRVIEPISERYLIDITTEILDYDLYTKPMHPSEWASILFNFMTNAKKAIDRAGVAGKIHISAGREDGMVYLDFADNGDGISPEIEDRIFDAFFTTSSSAGTLAEESEEILGTGLGLKIVKDIISSAGGEIELIDPPDGFSTCFRVEIPEAEEGEIADAY